MNIVGIDASPHSTGLVKFILDDNLEILDIKKLGFLGYTIPKKKKFEIPDYKDIVSYDEDKYDFFNRTLMMNDYIFDFIKDCEYAAVEDYSMFGSGLVFQLAEFCSQIKFQLIRQGTKVRLIEPLTLKMFATNDGRSHKPEMLTEFQNYTGVKFDITYLPDIPIHKKGKYVGLKNFEGISPTSDIVDSFFLTLLLHEELQIRKGNKQFSDLIPHHSHILSRKTKANIIPIYQKEFIQKKDCQKIS